MEATPPHWYQRWVRPGPGETLLLFSALLTVLLLLHLSWAPFREFVFQYYWGPILADARDAPVEGVSEGYNPYNTLTYGLVFLLGGLVIHRLLRWLSIPLDQRFILATLPLIVLGGLARSLEDTGLFQEPLAYLFIAPLIYFTLALGGVGVLLLGAGLRHLRERRNAGEAARLVLVSGLVFLSLYLALWTIDTPRLVHLVHPLDLTLLLLAVMAGGYYTYGIRPLREPVLVLGLGGLFSVGLALLWGAAFVEEPWQPAFPERAILWQVLGVWSLAMLVTVGGLLLLIRTRPGWSAQLQPYIAPLSLAMFGAHYLDGAATFLGIDQYGYTEKHVLPNLLIGWSGTAVIMLPLKALVVFVVIYFLDVAYKKEARAHPELFLLTKLLVITLGLAPGVRDVTRIYLGV